MIKRLIFTLFILWILPISVFAGHNNSVPSGYLRVGPFYVTSTNSVTKTTTEINTTCTSLNLATLYGLDSTAQSINLLLEEDIVNGTVSGEQLTTMNFYSDSNCTTKLGGNGASGVAVSVSSISGVSAVNRFQQNIELNNSGATVIYAKKSDTLVTGGSTHDYAIQVTSYRD